MSRPTSAYTMELRFYVCPSCGGPIDVSVAGGVFTCRFCSVQSHLEPRAKHPATGPRSPARMSEADRRNALLAQLGQMLVPTPRIAPLFALGSATGLWRREEVFAAWQSARKRTAEQGADAFEAAKELRFLTLVLGNQFVEQKDWIGHRALLESALEAAFLAHDRSSLAADLACGACRQDDLVGAKMWLAECDPASEDLYADSNYRIARSRIAQIEGDWREVLSALGARAGDVPIHASQEDGSAVSRANALEHLGDLAAAVRELEMRMGVGPSERRHVELLCRLNPRCAQSLPIAAAAVRQRASLIAANTAGGVEPTGLSALFGGRDARSAAAAETARRLAIEGIDARGKVLSITRLGEEIDDKPLQRFHVKVDLAGVPPYDAFVDLLLTDAECAALQGGVLFLLVDRNDPRIVASEAWGGPPA